MSSVKMRFGGTRTISNTSNDVLARGQLVYVDGSDDESVTLNFIPGGIYDLDTQEFNSSTYAARGHRYIKIYVPDGDGFATRAVSYSAIVTTTNSGVTIAYNDDSTVTLTPVSGYTTNYAVRRVY